jgi:RHS repeat-associated protein
MLAAAKDESVPLLAAVLLAENSRRGVATSTNELHRAFCLANSNTATGLDVCLYDSGRGSRSTGKERDQESALDYFGARYYRSALGRFTSADPLSGTVLHILNPQRWNMYAYAVNNPLFYVDPDGRDAIAVGFSKLASGLGHAAVISVHKDGTAEYGDFGPATPGSPVDAGKYNVFGLKTKIDFDSTGLPTQQSLAAVTKELAGTENQPETSIYTRIFQNVRPGYGGAGRLSQGSGRPTSTGEVAPLLCGISRLYLVLRLWHAEGWATERRAVDYGITEPNN